MKQIEAATRVVFPTASTVGVNDLRDLKLKTGYWYVDVQLFLIDYRNV